MIKFVVGLFIGAWLGVVAMAAIVVGLSNDSDGRLGTPDEPEVPDGFYPARGFDPTCSALCGNCHHFDNEIYAWGKMHFCDIDCRIVDAGDRCRFGKG